MIVVTGATGHFGRAVAEGLLATLRPSQLAVSVRDPAKASDFATRGIRVIRGDFAEPSTLPAAFEGAEQVLIVSVNALGEAAIRQHATAIQAARAAGARRVLYTSHQAASPSSKVAFARDHAATEALLRESTLPFVSLRNGFYTESSLYQLGSLRHSDRLRLPQDGPVSWTARADLAQAAVVALTQPALFDGITPPLTASQTHTFSDFTWLASGILERPITREVVSESDYRSEAQSHGYPEPMVAMLLSMFHAMQDGEFSTVDPTLERILNREPAGIESVLRRFLSQ